MILTANILSVALLTVCCLANGVDYGLIGGLSPGSISISFVLVLPRSVSFSANKSLFLSFQ